MRWALIIAGHLVGIALLTCLGYVLNRKIEPYAGYVTVFMGTLGLYVTALNYLYRYNVRFYVFVNRLLLHVERKHTYWNVDFHYDLPRSRLRNLGMLMDHLGDIFRAGRFGPIEVKKEDNRLNVYLLDHEIGLVLHLDESGLHLNTDRKLLVPSTLYANRGKLLRSIASEVGDCTKPARTRCTLEIFFRDGVRNPYYGFFVNQVPMGLVEDFNVAFRLDHGSESKVRACVDHIDVESTNIADGFEAFSSVLLLRALPLGDSR